MQLEAVDLLHVRVPLVQPFVTTRSRTAVKDVVLVRVRTADGVTGWGECAAEATPTYAPEYVDGVWQVLVEHLVPRLRAGRALDEVRGHHMAKAAIEMALLDARGRAEGRSLAALLGGRPGARLAVGVVVGADPDPAVVASRAAAHVAEGYRRVKVKLVPGDDRVVVDAVRAAVGDAVALWGDANGAYAAADAGHVANLGLDLVEQPFAAGDLVDHAAFRRAHPHVQVSLDESIASVHDARAALALGAASSLVVKPGRLGGLAAAVVVHDACRAAGVDVWCGGMLETGIGRAANLALASMPGFTLPGDLSASARYVARDLTEPFVLAPDGTLTVPEGPGLGITIDDEYVAACTVRRWTSPR